MTNRTIINNYVKALTDRAKQDGGVDYMAGYLHSTLLAMNLQSYETEALKADTKILKKLYKQEEDRRDERLKRIIANRVPNDRTYGVDWVMASR
jgi:hypothetical protein